MRCSSLKLLHIIQWFNITALIFYFTSLLFACIIIHYLKEYVYSVWFLFFFLKKKTNHCISLIVFVCQGYYDNRKICYQHLQHTVMCYFNLLPHVHPAARICPFHLGICHCHTSVTAGAWTQFQVNISLWLVISSCCSRNHLQLEFRLCLHEDFFSFQKLPHFAITVSAPLVLATVVASVPGTIPDLSVII